MQVQCPGQEDPLEDGIATHPSVLAWRIPWTEKPGRLQSIESQRAGHDRSDLAWMRVNVRSHCLLKGFFSKEVSEQIEDSGQKMNSVALC